MVATVHDIAKAAGLPVHTVIRALNGTTQCKRRDARERAEHIRKVADELGYHPNEAARTLSTKKSHNIAFVLSNKVDGGLCNSYYARILEGIEHVCQQNEIGVHLGITDLMNIKSLVFPKSLSGRNVDAVFLAGGIITPEILEAFGKMEIPGLCFSHCAISQKHAPKFFRVTRESFETFKASVKHLREYGHKKIAITEIKSKGTDERKKKLQASKEAEGVELVSFFHEGESEDEIINNIMCSYTGMPVDRRPSVIITPARIAVELIRRFAVMGIECPKDVSIIAHGYEEYFKYLNPVITSISLGEYDFGATAAREMSEYLLNDKPLNNIRITPNLKFIPGGSVRNFKKEQK